MSTITAETYHAVELAAKRAWADERMIFLELSEGRIIGFPAARFKLLRSATAEQLKKVVIELNGYALRWDELDEDITVPGVVAGHFQVLLFEIFIPDGLKP